MKLLFLFVGPLPPLSMPLCGMMMTNLFLYNEELHKGILIVYTIGKGFGGVLLWCTLSGEL